MLAVVGHRIIAPGVEGVTAQNPGDRQTNSPQYTKSFYCFEGIGGAGGLKTTTRREEGRNKFAVTDDPPQQDFFMAIA